MEAKDRIIFAADVGSSAELKEYLQKFKYEIGAVKVGMELLTHALLTGEPVYQMILSESGFRVMWDLKYSDIPPTVAGAAKEIAKWGQGRILGFTVHCLSGRRALADAVWAVKENFGEGPEAPMVIGITILTSLAQEDLTELGIQGTSKEAVLRLAEIAKDAGVTAIVCSPQETKDVLTINPNFTVINPGIRFAGSDLGSQKRVATPTEAIANGASYIVMGSDLRKGEPADNARRASVEIAEGLKDRLDLQLFDAEAVKFGAFRLKLHEKNPDAPLSPIYLNLRAQPSWIYDLMGDILHDAIAEAGIQFDYIVGIPKAGEPIVQVLAEKLGKKVLRLEKIESESGRRITSNLTGSFARGKRVLLVDDLVTQADTKREACQGIEANGLKVAGVAVVYDREQGGLEQLRNEGVNIFAVRKLSEMLNLYVSEGKITAQKRDEVIAYIAANR